MSFGILAVFGLLWLIFSVLAVLAPPLLDEQIGKELDQLLKSTGLDVESPVRERLIAIGHRRVRWGRIGSSAGALVGIGLAAVLPSAFAGSAALVIFLSWIWGDVAAKAFSAQPPRLPEGASRIASLQPHGLRDYLPTRDLALAACMTCAGPGIALGSGIALARGVGDDLSWVLASVLMASVLCGVMGAAGLLLERRLLALARPAQSVNALIADDIGLVWGLADTSRLMVGTLGLSVYVVSISVGPVWVMYAGAMCSGAIQMLWTGSRWRPRLRPAPVARTWSGKAVSA